MAQPTDDRRPVQRGKGEGCQRAGGRCLAAAKSTSKSIAASLDNAEFDLKQCPVYASADGFVTNWQVRAGTMAVPLPLAPMETFIDTSEAFVVATVGQNVLLHVQPGDHAEIASKSRPGKIFTGQVVTVSQVTVRIKAWMYYLLPF